MTPRPKRKKPKILLAEHIYKAKRGHIYDEDNKKFNCYMPAVQPVAGSSFYVLDCWPCDPEGNIHPGYNVSPVPILAENIGEMVK